ncbi:MAG: MBL fold metallo-hydrolase [Candidatus Odinarchaeota archaeon]|nr:MBL fold metallo-hydrolase [Candidatus Odinarchaeota archaeon]
MEIRFLGAAKEVTGSMHMVSIGDFDIILDAGKFSGPRKIEREKNGRFFFNPEEAERIILSHSHLDHSGRLPILMRRGFHGKIFTTGATADVMDVILRDAAEIEEKYIDMLRETLEDEPVEPLFTYSDVKAIYSHLVTYDYYKEFNLRDDITVTFYDAGHILGSASTKLTVQGKNSEINLLYTGDVGRPDMPFVRDPDIVKNVDYLIIEATYGDSLHESLGLAVEKIKRLVIWIYRHDGKLIVPSFALGRTQNLIYILNYLVEHGHIPVVPTYIDSPLATDIVDLYRSHKECYDEETWELINSGDNPLEFKGLHFVKSDSESRDLDYLRGPAIIISSSGMCTGGRVVRHLYHYIDKRNTAVLFTGYQAEGTLGREILEGARYIKLYGKRLSVRARIEQINGLSAHADQKELLNYIKHLGNIKKIFLVHGEKRALNTFSKILKKNCYDVKIPSLGNVWKLEKP